MKIKKVLAGIMLGVCLMGTTAMAGNGSFNFGVHTNGPEVGAGAWINKGIDESYAQITTNTFAGDGAVVYVKNQKFEVISNQATVRGKGYTKATYTSSAPTQKTYQLFAKAVKSTNGETRSTSLSGIWTP